MMTAEEVQELILHHDRAFQVWLNGFQAGHIEGTNQTILSNEQAAEMVARRVYALQLDEERHRTFARNAVQAIDIQQNRQRPDSTYIPMRKAA